jgi:transcriptional regulator with XRE-family HTH domain
VTAAPALALVRSGDVAHQAPAEAFTAEVRHWLTAAGLSQKELASKTGYTPSYVSKVLHGTITPSREFAEAADHATGAGRAILRRWHDLHPSDGGAPACRVHPAGAPGAAPGDLTHLHRTAVLRRTEVTRELAALRAELAYLDAILAVPLPAPGGAP